MKFIDETKIRAIAGDGGPGSVSFYRAKFVRRGPADGGNGGHGGDVVAIADPQLSTLLDLRYRKEWKARPGKRGGDADCDGGRGDDCIIKVPVGTLIRDVVSGELLADLKSPGERAVIAAGGRGGKGNAHFASSTNRSPRFCQPGEPGVERDLEVELRLLADVGIIGLPNAGKSTLISVISAVRPKIADYPFTTLVPNLGVVSYGEGKSFVAADIPGLIEGAHQGHGLGDKFLRHVLRTRVLVHMLDASQLDEKDPLAEWKAINREMELFDPELIDKPQLVVANKIDLPEGRDLAKLLGRKLPKAYRPLYVISAATTEGVQALVYAIGRKLDEVKQRSETDSDAAGA
ncbi:MAG TPA: GTPase ObgE [Candidatus Limnocylindria bacterium]|nr:GTPase ObgE [Candidatus Limnocylindria bacterium]